MAGVTQQISNAAQGTKARVFLANMKNNEDCLLFDCTKETTENDSNDVTQYAIENGTAVNDHVIQKPKTISISAILTDDLMSYDDRRIEGHWGKIQDRLQTLQRWLDDATLLLYCGYESDLDNMAIESVSRQESLDTGRGLGFSISLKRVVVADSAIVDIKVPIKSKGVCDKKKDTKQGTASNKSWLATAFGK